MLPLGQERALVGVRFYKQARAAEAHFRQAEQTSPSQTSPPECAKQQPESAKLQAAPASHEGTAQTATEHHEAGESQAQLRAIASDLLYWKGGLKILRQAQLPKWHGCFKWQIEAKVEALQAEHARLRAETAKPDG